MKLVEVEYKGKRRTVELGGDTMLNPGDTVGADFHGEGFVQATVISCEIFPDEPDEPKSDDSLLIGTIIAVTGGGSFGSSD